MGWLSGNDFFVFKQDGAHGASNTRVTRRRRFAGVRRRERRVVVKRLRGTFRARILTILKQSVVTTNNSVK